MADAKSLHADRAYGRTHSHKQQARNHTDFHRSRLKRSRFSYTPISTTLTDATDDNLGFAAGGDHWRSVPVPQEGSRSTD